MGRIRQKDVDWVRDTFRPIDALALLGRIEARSEGRSWCPLCGDPLRRRSREFWWSLHGWNCHRCGEHGDAIRLVMCHFGISFPQAIEKITGKVPHDSVQAVRNAAYNELQSEIRALDAWKARELVLLDCLWEFDEWLIAAAEREEAGSGVFVRERQDLDYWRAMDRVGYAHALCVRNVKRRYEREVAR